MHMNLHPLRMGSLLQNKLLHLSKEGNGTLHFYKTQDLIPTSFSALIQEAKEQDSCSCTKTLNKK